MRANVRTPRPCFVHLGAKLCYRNPIKIKFCSTGASNYVSGRFSEVGSFPWDQAYMCMPLSSRRQLTLYGSAVCIRAHAWHCTNGSTVYGHGRAESTSCLDDIKCRDCSFLKFRTVAENDLCGCHWHLCCMENFLVFTLYEVDVIAMHRPTESFEKKYCRIQQCTGSPDRNYLQLKIFYMFRIVHVFLLEDTVWFLTNFRVRVEVLKQ